MKRNIVIVITLFLNINIAFSQTIITDDQNVPIEGFGLVKDPNSNIVYFGKRDSLTSTAVYKGILVDGKIKSISKSPIIDATSQETIPFFSADGKYIFVFSNSKNASPQNIDLWFGRYNNGVIKDIKKAETINTDSVEYYGSMSDNGNLYFSSWRVNGYGKGDIYSTKFKKGKFSSIQSLNTHINNSLVNSSPAIALNESWVIYYTENTATKIADLVISFKKKGKWSKPLILPDIVNTANFEFAPVVGDKGNSLYFSRREKSSISGELVYHIYKVSIDKLKLAALKLQAEY